MDGKKNMQTIFIFCFAVHDNCDSKCRKHLICKLQLNYSQQKILVLLARKKTDELNIVIQ